MRSAPKLLASERLRHAGIAILLALFVGVTTILRPLDITVWSLQAKLFQRSASGDIVFVELESERDRANIAFQNAQIDDLLSRLKTARAGQIVIDAAVLRSGDKAIDAQLRAEIESMENRPIFTRTLGPPGEQRQGRAVADKHTDAYFIEGSPVASNDYQADFLGYIWALEATYGSGDSAHAALWTVLAGDSGSRKMIYPDYSIDSETIPAFSAQSFLALPSDELTRRIADKTIVIGEGKLVRVPELGPTPSSLVHIIAAETVQRGSGHLLDWPLVMTMFVLLLAVAILGSRDRTARRAIYGLICAAFVTLFISTSVLGARGFFAETFVLLASYAIMRGVARYRQRHLLIEPRSKLPNFTALRRDLSEPSRRVTYTVVVAKISRLDLVFTTLTVAEQAKYLRKIAERLALGERETTIYYDGGKYFALLLTRGDYDDIESHLLGLRAIASQSIVIGSRSLDVSMTIGVDDAIEMADASRVSSAIAAADQAREAYRPVFIISEIDAPAEDWDHSLQSRLEEALSEDRIGIQLQPQAELQSGLIVAAEALARWSDRERGDIAPWRFISQCERVGRLDELTKRVFVKSFNAAEQLNARGFHPRISINVSAIQFVDQRVADLIETAMAGRNLDPADFTVELTETARIEDFAIAREIVERIKRIGLRLSIDDFGVGSANFEAMMELPFDELKIDRMFVSRIKQSDVAREIVRNLTRLATDAGISSVAEGIEDRETYEILRDFGCELGQGYYIARPLVIEGFIEFLLLQGDSPMIDRLIG